MSYQGRVPIIKSPEQLEKSIAEYFAFCEKGKAYSWVNKKGELLTGQLSIPPSTESLSLHLGFMNRTSLAEYETRNEGHEVYAVIIKRAKSKIAADKLAMAERGLLNDRVVMFDLAVNHGYIQEINVNFNEVRQLSDQDRLLLSNVLRQLPSQLRALPQAAIEAEVAEVTATESSNNPDYVSEQD